MAAWEAAGSLRSLRQGSKYIELKPCLLILPTILIKPPKCTGEAFPSFFSLLVPESKQFVLKFIQRWQCDSPVWLLGRGHPTCRLVVYKVLSDSDPGCVIPPNESLIFKTTNTDPP